MNEYLIQLQVKKPNGKIHLISIVREAASIEAAYREALGMSAGSGEIVGGYATGDPYKIGEWVCRNRLPAYMKLPTELDPETVEFARNVSKAVEQWESTIED